MPKYAVLSMDVEEWFHPDYLLNIQMDRTPSVLDGVDVFSHILDESGIRGSFFVVSEIAGRAADVLRALADSGHDVSCHGLTHVRPLDLDEETFSAQLRRARGMLAAVTGAEVRGYRAPSFGLDDARFQIVRDAGFSYDASHILSHMNPVYGSFSLDGFTPVLSHMHRDNGFCAFTASTQEFLGRQIPLGGGFFRMFPWLFTRFQLARYTKKNDLFILFVHPGELSHRPIPHPDGVSPRRYAQSTAGRHTVEKKVRRTIRYLKKRGFSFVTFADLCEAYGGGEHV